MPTSSVPSPARIPIPPHRSGAETGSRITRRSVAEAGTKTTHRSAAETGSQTTEYALILVVAATIASLALAWARNGAIADLLDGVLDHVRTLFGVS